MKLGKRIAVVAGVVCGAELLVAVVIGGAGLGAVFGWNGVVVAVAALTLTVAFVAGRRGSRVTGATSEAEPDLASEGRVT